MTTTAWIDAHCHLADPRWQGDLAAHLERAREKGVGKWIQGGVDPEDWERQKALRQKLGNAIITCFGLHPWWVASATEAQIQAGLDRLEKNSSGADAWGELGLDFSPKRDTSRKNQISTFESQLAIARRDPKPLVLHIVGAHEDAVRILKKQGPFEQRGLVHAFSASKELANQYIDLGFLISIGGAATKPEREKLQETLRWIPEEHLVVETDAPDQKPAGIQEALNEPVNLLKIASAIAAIRGEDGTDLLTRSSQTLTALFENGPRP